MILPAFLGIVGVVVDGGLLTAHQRHLQNVADAAATAAAMDLFQGRSDEQARFTIREVVRTRNSLPDAQVQLNHPPTRGRYATNPQYVELILSRNVTTYLVHVLGGQSVRTVGARAVAGFEPSTAGAALTVLSTSPYRQDAGLDLATGGTITIDGAVLVNDERGALDEDGLPAGRNAGSPFAVRSAGNMLVADDLRVAGGVDDPRQYRHANLKANQLPVENPLRKLRPPRIHETNHRTGHSVEFGGVEIPDSNVQRPSRGRLRRRTLDPGIYDWIQVSSGRVTFRPGIYFIRSVHPRSGLALNVRGGHVTARGVLFYIASARLSWSGSVDTGEYQGDSEPWGRGAYRRRFRFGRSATSVVIDAGLQSEFAPFRDGSSPYDGILLYQGEDDGRRIEIHDMSSSGQLSGIIYAKSGHLDLSVRGTCRASFVVGTMRVQASGGCRIEPLRLLPPAEDVYLVE
jgi:Flp pilus assembly protein TadG